MPAPEDKLKPGESRLFTADYVVKLAAVIDQNPAYFHPIVDSFGKIKFEDWMRLAAPEGTALTHRFLFERCSELYWNDPEHYISLRNQEAELTPHQKRVQDELDGNPEWMDRIAETQGQIEFDDWCLEFGLDAGCQIYVDVHDLALERFDEDPSQYPVNYAELRQAAATREALVNAGWDESTSNSNIGAAVEEVYASLAAEKNAQGVVAQVQFLRLNGYSQEDVERLVVGEAPKP
jgi:hypothetical protein